MYQNQYIIMSTFKQMNRFTKMKNKIPQIKPGQVRVNPERKMKLEQAALEITIKTKTVTSYSDVINYLIDNYLEEAKKDIK